jgi:hypothetical protein
MPGKRVADQETLLHVQSGCVMDKGKPFCAACFACLPEALSCEVAS